VESQRIEDGAGAEAGGTTVDGRSQTAEVKPGTWEQRIERLYFPGFLASCYTLNSYTSSAWMVFQQPGSEFKTRLHPSNSHPALMTCTSDFWDALAPHHSVMENSYLDLPSLRLIQRDIHPPALVVGAGQGLIVAALQKQGLQCDGVDLSLEMIRYARLRRGLDLVHADAKALPFENRTYKTIIYATGVVDFLSDEETIMVIMNEARRIVETSGSIFVAFYKFSAATEDFLISLHLLKNNVLRFRELLEIYRLTPVQTISWVAKRAKTGYCGAVMLALRSWAFSSWQEKRNAFHMQRAFAKAEHADALIQAAPEEQTYRNEVEIRNLFTRLAIPISQWATSGSSHMVRV